MISQLLGVRVLKVPASCKAIRNRRFPHAAGAWLQAALLFPLPAASSCVLRPSGAAQQPVAPRHCGLPAETMLQDDARFIS